MSNSSLTEALQLKQSIGDYDINEIKELFKTHQDSKEQINFLNSEVRRIILLRFYISFNIFESYFFIKKKDWFFDEKKQKKIYRWEYNSDRFTAIEDFCHSHNLCFRNNSLSELHNHFRDVYFPSGKWNSNRGASFNYNDKTILQEFLCKNLESKETYEISAALRLCYSFRNNLVHGAKDIFQVDNYILDFIYIEKFLEELMNFIYKINPKKKF